MPALTRIRLATLVVGLGLSAALAGAADKKAPADKPGKSDPKLPVARPKTPPKDDSDPKHLPKVDPKASTDALELVPKFDPKLPMPEAKVLSRSEHRPMPVRDHTADKPKGPGLKLPAGVTLDRDELARLKPPVDLTKTKPGTVLAARPPADFRLKSVKLDQIHVPADAAKVDKLTLSAVTASQAFVLNKNAYTGMDYHTKYGTKTSAGYYCYPGKHHCHWHHCIWDPCFGCHYFYCPCTCCYYYWCEADCCYYPCYWFVEYGTCYYPWWVSGGFAG